MSVESVEGILERLMKLVESMDDENRREEFLKGPIACLATLHQMECALAIEDSVGALLVNAIARARPLPPRGAPRLADMHLGPAHANAMRDLDRGRGEPMTDSGSIDGIEAVQRLGDFVAAADPDLHAGLQYGICIRGDDPKVLGRHILRRVNKQWETHVDITTTRVAIGCGRRLVQAQRAAKGGRAKRRPTSPAAILVAAVVKERPRLLDEGKTLRDLVAVLRDAPTDVWGDVTVDSVTMAYDSKKRRWSGSAIVSIVGGDAQQVKPGMLRKAFKRAQDSAK